MRTRSARLAILLLAAACTDAELYLKPQPEAAVARVQAGGAVCAPPDDTIEVPYRILFVIDTSASNSDTDPPLAGGVVDPVAGVTRREAAVREAITQNIAKPNVSFGIITFSDYPQVQTFGFTRDMAALSAAITNIGTAVGWTNYSDTLLKVTDFIVKDIEELGPTRAHRVHYQVFWLSDGYPTRGITSTDPAVLSTALSSGVDYLARTVAESGAELVFNTAYLGGGLEPVDAQAAAQQLLRDLSAVADGAFTDIAAGEQVVFPIDPKPLVRRFVMSGKTVAFNHNVRLGAGGPLADSDGDGIPDEEELGEGLDPTDADTDGDGLRDGVERLAPSSANPLRAAAVASGAQDADGDGLSDAEEALLGTDPREADTDGDYLLDAFEALYGSSPLNAAMVDADQDGVSDIGEVRAHLDPGSPTVQGEVEKWSYTYSVEEIADAGPTRCYRVLIGNVALMQTLAHAGKPVGTNRIDVVLAFEPEDGGKPVYFYRTSKEARFLAPDAIDPVSAEFELNASEFEVLP